MPAKNETTMGSARLKHILYYLSWLNQLGVPNTSIAKGIGVSTLALGSWMNSQHGPNEENERAAVRYLDTRWGIDVDWEINEEMDIGACVPSVKLGVRQVEREVRLTVTKRPLEHVPLEDLFFEIRLRVQGYDDSTAPVQVIRENEYIEDEDPAMYLRCLVHDRGVPNTVIAAGLGVHVNTLRTWLGRAPKKDTKFGDALRKYLAEHWGVTHLWPASE